MHDPLVVAFQVKSPWRRKYHGVLKGRSYRTDLVVVWHREPKGRDSGQVCRHYRRTFDEDKHQWRHVPTNGWRFHVHHWRLQLPPLQHLRRSLLTRCAWCGGRSRKDDRVNTSHSWDGPRGHWWQGEPGLFHGDCSSVERAHATCLCAQPRLELPSSEFGNCLTCGKFHPWRHRPDEADRLLTAIPAGGRITPDVRPAIEAAWAKRRAARETAA